jgi:hypothetical protein
MGGWLRSATVPRSTLEHPILGVNRPMRNEAQLSKMVEMVRQSLTTESNSPKILDSSSKSTPKPSKKQPPSDYRMLRSAKDEPRRPDDLCWSMSDQGWVQIDRCVFQANRDNWAACRKIEEPSKPPLSGHYCDAESIWVDEPNPFEGRNEKNADKISVSGLVESLSQAMQNDQDLAWTWHCNIAVGSLNEGVDHKTANLAAARFMSIAFGVDMTSFEEWKRFDWVACRKIEVTSPPPKRYREPTLADLANGPIACEYRDSDQEQWKSGLLVCVLDGDQPFLCIDCDIAIQWKQCQTEVTGDS